MKNVNHRTHMICKIKHKSYTQLSKVDSTIIYQNYNIIIDASHKPQQNQQKVVEDSIGKSIN